MIKLKKLMGEGTKPPSPMHNEARRHFLEVISTYKAFGRKLQAEHDLAEIANTLGGIVDAATTFAVKESGNNFDPATVKRNMGDLGKLSAQFEKSALEAKQLQQRMSSLYEDMGHVLGRYFDMQEISDEDADFRLGKRPPKMEQSSKLNSLMPQQTNEAEGPCWKGYKQIGMKDKGGRQVPNCVPNESVVNEGNTAYETLMLIRNLEQTNKLLAQDLKTSKRLPNDKKENIKKSIVVNQGLINYYKETYKNLKNNESVNEASPCWKGYKQVGMKDKGGRQVPNCVPNESVVKEATYNFGKEEYTKKNLTPTQIQDLAFGYVQTPITKLVGKTLGHRVNLANDLAKLTGTKQLDAKARGKEAALIMVLLKNKLVSKEEYIQMYKDLIEKHQQVIKYLKNASPEMRNSGGAARAAAKDMKGEFDMD